MASGLVAFEFFARQGPPIGFEKMRKFIAAINAEISRLKWLTALNNLETAVRRYRLAERHELACKYSPDQLRIPAGNPDGGQWTSIGVDAGSASETSRDEDAYVDRVLAFAQRTAASGSPISYQKCLDLCYPILERPKPPGSDRNTWDFIRCMNACLGRNR